MTEVTRAASDGSRAANGGPATPEGGPRGSLSTDDAPVTPGGGPLTERYGCARRPGRPVARRRPPGVSDATVAALGKLSEALETVEHARGLLYGFHRLSGTADRLLQDAVAMLRDAGHTQVADDIDEALVGRDTINGQWSFQLVEAYDAGYWQVFRDAEQYARTELHVPARHVHEAEMKPRSRTVPERAAAGGRIGDGDWTLMRSAAAEPAPPHAGRSLSRRRAARPQDGAVRSSSGLLCPPRRRAYRRPPRQW